ncbi:type 1 glutamine amidotransferase [Amphritea sp. 1_MG-2023]|uniref:type 1 glutamine amidotransferase n=1 Tax=Amphritea sp. 1_MG-2023 TaxID=3062670 RepID=UPI0026E163B0|nr:type 1 glutamine amidotransferase [Amphritea sp. 1_MG-2023]MDO6564509.1 type 1 glutamine amidotransferase [Amphritea sp. 1_MG-2023]
MIRVLILQHAEGEWIGSMHDWFTDPCRRHDFVLNTVRLNRGATLPDVDSFDWLLPMGGPMSVNNETDYPWLVAEKTFIRQAIENDKTILGICLGGQLIAAAAGAEVYRNTTTEIGWWPVIKTDHAVTWLPEIMSPLSWHGDCFRLPAGAIPFAYSAVTPCQGFRLGQRIWALQFHLEAAPGTIDAFLAFEPDGLPHGKAVQTSDQLRNDTEFLPQSRQAMHQLLEALYEPAHVD